MTLRLRRALASDEALLLAWANDPSVRAGARNTATISAPEHRRWLQEKLADPMCRIWIAEKDAVPLGQIRLDRNGADAEIDVSVEPSARGCGVGSFMLTAPEIAGWPGLRRLLAAVRRENAASLALFRGAGFSEMRQESTQESDYVYFERTLSHAAPG